MIIESDLEIINGVLSKAIVLLAFVAISHTYKRSKEIFKGCSNTELKVNQNYYID